jgi:hypothetical protein
LPPEVRDGAAFAYRLRLAGPEPDFRLHLAADALSVPRGRSARLRVTAQRSGGFSGPISLAVEGLPAGVKVTNTTLGAGQPFLDLTFAAGPSATLGAQRVTVRGSATVAGRTVGHPATLPGESAGEVLLGVGLPAPFKFAGSYDLRLAPRGTLFRKRCKIERGGYAGPLQVRLADRQARHLQGVTGPVLSVPAGVDEFEYPVYLPPWMETGRTSRSCLMLVGVVKEGSREHTVSYTSQAQNDQVIAVVETGPLGVEAAVTSLAARPGTSLAVPVTVRRGKGLAGAVAVEIVCPEHVRGLSAERLVIPAGRSTGTLTVRFARAGLGPFNAPLLLRATLRGAGGPVVAEAQVEVVAEE